MVSQFNCKHHGEIETGDANVSVSVKSDDRNDVDESGSFGEIEEGVLRDLELALYWQVIRKSKNIALATDATYEFQSKKEVVDA